MTGIEKYEAQLEKLDGYLNVSPNKSVVAYKELWQQAVKDDNKTLQSLLHLYNGTIFYYVGNKDSALVYFDKGIELANEINNSQLRSSGTIRKLFVLQGSNNTEAIYRLMKEEYVTASKNHDTLNMIYSLNGQALCQDNLDNTQECIELYLDAMELAKSNKNDYEYGFLLNNIGLLKLKLKHPDEAIEDLNEGLEIARKLNNTRLEVVLRENVGYYYMEVDSIDLARKEYEETYELAKRKNFSHLAFNSIVNLGVMSRRLGDFEKSDSLLNSALEMGRREKLYYSLPPIFLTKAQLELQAKNYHNVEPLLDSAMKYAQFTSLTQVEEGKYVITYRMYESMGNHKKALEYYKKLSHFRDSVNKNGHMQMIAELELRHNVERKEKQRLEEKREYEQELADKERQTERLRQNIAIGIIVVILLIGGFIIYYFKEKHKKEAEFSSALVNKLEEERGRIARDLHDGLGQSLVILKNKFNKLGSNDPVGSEAINENFTETIEQVRSISRSLIPPELRRLGLKMSIEKMLKDIEESSSLISTFDLDALDELTLDSGQEIRIYRIIQELSNNTLKHSDASSMKVDFSLQGNKLEIVYQDNGKGFDHETTVQAQEKSIGLKSIDQRLKYLNGTIKYEKPSRGFKAIIKIKLKA